MFFKILLIINSRQCWENSFFLNNIQNCQWHLCSYLCTISITNSLKCFSGSGVGDLEFGTESTCASGNYCAKYTVSAGGVDAHTKGCGSITDIGVTGKLDKSIYN